LNNCGENGESVFESRCESKIYAFKEIVSNCSAKEFKVDPDCGKKKRDCLLSFESIKGKFNSRRADCFSVHFL
jgi:hypothetical protein